MEGYTENTYWLHQHVVLSKQKCSSGVLVEWFNVVLHPHERTIIHAATGLSLLDLIQEESHIRYNIQSFLADYLIRNDWSPSLSDQGRPSGGRILPTVAAVDAVPLYKLISRWVCPEMVCSLNFGVLQSTRPNCVKTVQFRFFLNDWSCKQKVNTGRQSKGFDS